MTAKLSNHNRRCDCAYPGEYICYWCHKKCRCGRELRNHSPACVEKAAQAKLRDMRKRCANCGHWFDEHPVRVTDLYCTKYVYDFNRG